MSAPAIPQAVPQPLMVPPELIPSVHDLVTEDDTPVDNIYSERQQRLLIRPLYVSWIPPGDVRSFVALVNVGMFFAVDKPPFVPGFLLSLGVTLPADVHEKQNRSYFIWKYGKAPDVALEVVSNKEGEELGKKKIEYAQIGIPLYIVWDPEQLISKTPLQVFSLRFRTYELDTRRWFPELGLGLTTWQGRFEGMDDEWLRWCDQSGQILPTGEEHAQQESQRADRERQYAEEERQRAEQEQQRADQERQRADEERQRADRLAAHLRQLGVEPQ